MMTPDEKKLKEKAQVKYWSCKQRCTDPNVKGYERYGARGIKCRFESSQHLIDTIGLPPTLKHTLERIDNEGHYEPGNVRWATWQEQANNRRSNRWLEIDGEKKTISEWSRVSGIGAKVIYLRYVRSGWPAKDAVFAPLNSIRIIENKSFISRHTKKKKKKYEPITVNGVTKSISQWAKEAGLAHSTIRQRLLRGIPPEKAVQPKENTAPNLP